MQHTFTIEQINHPRLLESMTLFKQKVLWKTPRDIIHCINVMEDVYKHVKKSQEVYKQLTEQYAKRDEKGDIVFTDDKVKQPVFENPEEFKKAFDEMLKTELPLMGKLDLSQVVKCELSAAELEPIRFLLHNL